MEPLLISLKILIPIALVIIILITIVWILFYQNTKVGKKIITEKVKYNKFKKQIDSLKDSRESPEKDFKKIDTLARDFFKEYYNLGYDLTYLEIAKRLEKRNKKEFINFCKQISDIKYSGKQINAKNIAQLTKTLDKTIKSKAV